MECIEPTPFCNATSTLQSWRKDRSILTPSRPEPSHFCSKRAERPEGRHGGRVGNHLCQICQWMNWVGDGWTRLNTFFLEQTPSFWAEELPEFCWIRRRTFSRPRPVALRHRCVAALQHHPGIGRCGRGCRWDCGRFFGFHPESHLHLGGD